MTGGIGLALVCVATLVWLVLHIATSINVEKLVYAVHHDLIQAVQSGTRETADFAPVYFEPGSPLSCRQLAIRTSLFDVAICI